MKARHKAKPVLPEIGDVDRLGGNSDLHVAPKPHPLFGPPPSIVETVLFGRVGHTFRKHPHNALGSKGYLVQDFLLDQTGASGADGKMSNVNLFDLTASTGYRFNVFPKNRAKRIKVEIPISAQVIMGNSSEGTPRWEQ